MKKIIATLPEPVIPPLTFTVNGEASLEEILKRVEAKTLILESNDPDFNALEEVKKCDWSHHPETRMYAYCRKSLGFTRGLVNQASVVETLIAKDRGLCTFHQALRSFFKIEQLDCHESEYLVIVKQDPRVGEVEHIKINFVPTPKIRINIKQKTAGRTMYLGAPVVVIDREGERQTCPHGE